MRSRTQCELAWNAALDAVGDEGYDHLKVPSKAFDDWYEHNILNPPKGWEDHYAT